MRLGLAANRRDFSVATNAMSGVDNPGPLLAWVGFPLYRRPYSGWLQDKDRSASIQQGQGKDNRELAGCWRDCQPWGRIRAEGGSWAQTSKVCWEVGHYLRVTF